MRTVTVREAETALGTLLHDAAREPVTVTQDGGPDGVLLSAESYARLRGDAKAALLAALKRTQDYAETQGLTEAELERLLADDSWASRHRHQHPDQRGALWRRQGHTIGDSCRATEPMPP